MSLSDAIKADSSKVFLRSQDFAETVVYHPRCGSARPIKVIVDREPGQILIGSDVVTPALTIDVDNNRTTGIRHDEIDAGDQLEVSIRAGGKATKQTFRVVQASDEAMLTIAVT